MDKLIAKQILIKSITNLQQRRGQINVPDVEAEVINNACLAILRDNAVSNSLEYAEIFTQSARELIPQYGEEESVVALMGISQNVLWEGMWDHLRNYFQKNHGFLIDKVETIPLTFYSTNHSRYENGKLVSEGPADRVINITFIDNKKEIIISIEPTLSPKKGYVISKHPNQLQFKGYDPDYLFTVAFDSFDEIDKVTLEMPNRNLKIIYCE